MIDSISFHDEAQDCYGNRLTRLKVRVDVLRYDVSKIRPFGMKPVWEDDLPEETKLS